MEIPEILWGVDPLLHVHLQLMIFQVHALKRVPHWEGIYRHHSHPIRSVEIVGVVQMVHRGPKFILYNLDDGTGVIQCVNWIPDKYQSIQDTSKIPELQVHELGEVIRVHGQPTEFKGSMQITFQPGDSATCNDPNEETVFRLRVLNQERSVYRKPIVLPDIILSEIDIQDSKKESLLSSSSPGLSEMTLMNKIKEWIASRDEFCYLDLEDDEENNRIACDLAEAMHPNLPLGFRVQHEASRLMNECVKQLVLEGVLEYRNRKHMILAVVRSSVRTSTTAAGAAASSSAAAMTRQETPELVEVERGALVRHPIVLVDSGDEEDTA